MPDRHLTVTPLGGLGEIGLNCQKWECGQGSVLVDCGLMFPDDSQLGVDVVIPLFDSLFAEGERPLGVVLTHGHEDHIGALPWMIFQYKGMLGTPLPIYASPFTLALVEHKLTEHGLLDRVELHPMNPYDHVQLGELDFHFTPVCHSIPQSYALLVDTPVGKVVHTGDFKLDDEPLGEAATMLEDISNFAGKEGIRLLMSDSTNIEEDGHSHNEREVRGNMQKIFDKAEGRIFIALFSSHIERIRMVLELAAAGGRPVLVSGRSLASNIEKAVNLGLLEKPAELYTEQEGYPDDSSRMVILATGTQGEPLSAMTRIANGEHRQLALHEGDTVIMSSRVIPGNARAVSRVENQMYRQGATVYHGSKHVIHATGHACRDELRTVLELCSPEWFVPVHGEYRNLALHAKLARECGVAADHVLVLENGHPFTLTPEGLKLEPVVPADSVLVDGKGVGDVGRLVLKERRILGNAGVVIVILVIAGDTGEVLYGPEMISRGFVFEQLYEHVLEDSKCLVLDQLEDMGVTGEYDRLQDRIRSSMRRFFRDVLGRDPVVLPVVTVV